MVIKIILKTFAHLDNNHHIRDSQWKLESPSHFGVKSLAFQLQKAEGAFVLLDWSPAYGFNDPKIFMRPHYEPNIKSLLKEYYW